MKRRHYPVVALLVALTALPLCAAGWFAAGEIGTVGDERAQAEAADDMAQDLLVLTELQTKLLEERTWASIASGLRDLGLDPGLTRVFLGVDLAAELDTTTRRVDELVDESGLTDLEEPLRRVRTVPMDLESESEIYFRLEEAVTLEAEQLLNDLLLTAANVRGGDELSKALATLDRAAVVRRALASELTFFYRAQFSAGGDSAPVEQLIASRAQRVRAMAELARTIPTIGPLSAAVDASEQSASVRSFNDISDELIGRSFSRAERTGGDLELVLEDLDGVAAVLRAANDASALHLDMVNAAGADVRAASQAIEREAETSARRTVLFLITFAGSTMLFALGANRAIGRPLRELALTARRLSNGESAARFTSPSGPIEIQDAARAINEAATHLELAERQTAALAEGDLQSSVLDQTNNGRLGASLQHAVQTLATSMQDREEFRRRMAHEATHDGLTQIPNRNASLAHLKRGLARTRRNDSSVAVLSSIWTASRPSTIDTVTTPAITFSGLRADVWPPAFGKATRSAASAATSSS